MEGVGARLGRSSTRYGPTTVFTGPVRRWKKTWVPLSNAATTNSTPSAANGSSNNQSRLLLYKWTPVSGNGKDGTKDSAAAAAEEEEPRRRKFRYVSVAAVEEQKEEAALKSDDDIKLNDADQNEVHGSDEKPDMNDLAEEDTQAAVRKQAPSGDVRRTNLDLSLGLQAHGGEHESDGKGIERDGNGGHLDRATPGEDLDMQPTKNTESENRRKRKVAAPDLEMRM